MRLKKTIFEKLIERVNDTSRQRLYLKGVIFVFLFASLSQLAEAFGGTYSAWLKAFGFDGMLIFFSIAVSATARLPKRPWLILSLLTTFALGALGLSIFFQVYYELNKRVLEYNQTHYYGDSMTIEKILQKLSPWEYKFIWASSGFLGVVIIILIIVDFILVYVENQTKLIEEKQQRNHENYLKYKKKKAKFR